MDSAATGGIPVAAAAIGANDWALAWHDATQVDKRRQSESKWPKPAQSSIEGGTGPLLGASAVSVGQGRVPFWVVFDR